jgi:hypothetical protein
MVEPMATDDPSASEPRDRRRSLIVALAIVVALLVFLVGYLLGRGPSETAASASPSATVTPSPTIASSAPSATETPPPSPTGTTSEPGGDELPDDTLFVQLADLQGGEDGPPTVDYDLAYFYTGEQASQEAAARGMDPPEAGYLIVNDNPKLRHAPLSEDFSVKYLPEGSGLSTPVKAHQAQFLGWLAGSVQTDFPSTDASWWWITLENGEITTVKQQYLP